MRTPIVVATGAFLLLSSGCSTPTPQAKITQTVTATSVKTLEAETVTKTKTKTKTKTATSTSTTTTTETKTAALPEVPAPEPEPTPSGTYVPPITDTVLGSDGKLYEVPQTDSGLERWCSDMSIPQDVKQQPCFGN